MACYDFPELVIHERNGTCPRYNGGVCHPLPTPVEPYANEEEAEAVRLYNDALENGIRATRVFHAEDTGGATIYPGEEGKA